MNEGWNTVGNKRMWEREMTKGDRRMREGWTTGGCGRDGGHLEVPSS